MTKCPWVWHNKHVQSSVGNAVNVGSFVNYTTNDVMVMEIENEWETLANQEKEQEQEQEKSAARIPVAKILTMSLVPGCTNPEAKVDLQSDHYSYSYYCQQWMPPIVSFRTTVCVQQKPMELHCY